MAKVIVIFKEQSNEELITRVGGTILDDLSKMPKLLIADVPKDQIEVLSNSEEVELVEMDSPLVVERQEAVVPYSTALLTGPNGYILVPELTYDAVELDLQITERVASTTYYLFDNRYQGTAYLYRGTANTDIFGNCTVYVDGVQKTSGTAFMPLNTRCLLEIRLTGASKAVTYLMSYIGERLSTIGKVFSVKFKNGGVVVAHYDMSKGSLYDQTGNGYDGTLQDATWLYNDTPIAEEVPFENVDGSLDWGLTLLKAKDYWDRGLTGKGVKIALMDESFPPHAFVKYKGTWNIVDNKEDTSPPGYGNVVHGLNTSTQITMDMVKHNQYYHMGIANGMELYGLDCLHNGGVNAANFVSSVNWAMTNEIDIISASLLVREGNAGHAASVTAVNTFVDNGGVFFMSSGNFREPIPTDSINYLAKTVTIGGLDTKLQRYDTGSSGSNYGPRLDYMTYYGFVIYADTTIAPAFSSQIGRGRGTSFACPLGAGVFGLYRQAYPDKTNAEVLEMMKPASRQLNGYTSRNDQFGHGLLQPNKEILSRPRVIEENGLRYDGNGDYVDAGNHSSLNLTNNLTIIMDLRQDYGNSGHLISKVVDQGILYGVRIGYTKATGNSITVKYAHGTNTFTEVNFPLSISDNDRKRLAIVYNNPNVLIYLNGKLITTLTMAGSMLSQNTFTNPKLLIGSSRKPKEKSFCGIMYNTKMYNRSLSAAEIGTDYTSGNVTSGLVLHYNFLNNKGVTITDSSGTGNHGTIIGARPHVRMI